MIYVVNEISKPVVSRFRKFQPFMQYLVKIREGTRDAKHRGGNIGIL